MPGQLWCDLVLLGCAAVAECHASKLVGPASCILDQLATEGGAASKTGRAVCAVLHCVCCSVVATAGLICAQAEAEHNHLMTVRAFFEYQRNKLLVNFRKLDTPRVCLSRL